MRLGTETWRTLEELAARIYSELDAACIVTHDARVPGVLSETPRQIDVLIESPSLGTRVVVDCKDWARRVDVSDVGQFASLVEDVEATGGVMICNRGFSKAGRTLARNKGITLCGLHDAESRRWQLDVRMPVLWKQVQPIGGDARVDLLVHLEEGDQLSKVEPMRVRVAGHEADPVELFSRGWNAGEFPVAREGWWTASTQVELITLAGDSRPGTLSFNFRVRVAAKLGYVTPQESRGIVHEEAGAYETVVLNLGETVRQEPENGWHDAGNGSDVVIAPRATIIEMRDVEGLEARLIGGVRDFRLVRAD